MSPEDRNKYVGYHPTISKKLKMIQSGSQKERFLEQLLSENRSIRLKTLTQAFHERFYLQYKEITLWAQNGYSQSRWGNRRSEARYGWGISSEIYLLLGILSVVETMRKWLFQGQALYPRERDDIPEYVLDPLRLINEAFTYYMVGEPGGLTAMNDFAIYRDSNELHSYLFA